MRILSEIPLSEQRREGSAWQGGPGPRHTDAAPDAAPVDLALNAWLGRLTGHVSPAAPYPAWSRRPAAPCCSLDAHGAPRRYCKGMRA